MKKVLITILLTAATLNFTGCIAVGSKSKITNLSPKTETVAPAKLENNLSYAVSFTHKKDETFREEFDKYLNVAFKKKAVKISPTGAAISIEIDKIDRLSKTSRVLLGNMAGNAHVPATVRFPNGESLKVVGQTRFRTFVNFSNTSDALEFAANAIAEETAKRL